MSAWPFLMFTAACGLILYLHFFLAHREFRRMRTHEDSEIDPDYVRIEDFLAKSFRLKVRDWLKMPPLSVDEAGRRTIELGSDLICVTSGMTAESGTRCDEVLIVQGDFTAGPDSVYSRELYVRGHARIGRGSQVQAVACDGTLFLGPRTSVVRWVDSTGRLDVGPGCHVRGRATSRAAIRLGTGTCVSSAFAPEVETPGRDDAGAAAHGRSLNPLIEIHADEPLNKRAPGPGFDPRRLSRLSADCWAYRGDLRPGSPIRLKTSLVVHGDFLCPAGSVLEADVKVAGSARIQEGSRCQGNLVAGGDVHLGPGVTFEGIVDAGGALRLSRGVRGLRADGYVVARAAGPVYVENNVVIKGKLVSGEQVVAVGPPSDTGSRVADVQAEEEEVVA